MNTQGVVELQGIHFKYPGSDREQLRDFSMAAQAGQCTALLGPSGCAKSTVLRLIAGLERAHKGTITIGEQILSGPSSHIPPEKRGVGMVFQDYGLFPHMTVRKNVSYGLHGLARNQREDRVRETLALVGLEDLATRYPHQLSGGQQQRVALARALAPYPRVLLLDEPFSNLDADLKTQVRSELGVVLQKAGVTSILVTHDVADAEALAHSIVRMKAPD